MIRVPSGLNWENATYVSHRNGLKMGVPPQRARRLSRATSTRGKVAEECFDTKLQRFHGSLAAIQTRRSRQFIGKIA
jgi:hypothetical protein